MNTTTAAHTAGVTVDTVRTWCRIGAVAAIKRAGRWVIDAASLAYRISLGRTTVDTTPRYADCGHEVTATRRQKARGITPTNKPGLCRDCTHTAREQATTDTLQGIVWPTLTGTPKQVAWATDIRTQWANTKITADILPGEDLAISVDTGTGSGLVPPSYPTAEQAAEAINTLVAPHADAAWWITNRATVTLALLAHQSRTNRQK